MRIVGAIDPQQTEWTRFEVSVKENSHSFICMEPLMNRNQQCIVRVTEATYFHADMHL